MNNIGTNIPAYANVVTPFSSVGKQAVGLENADAKEEVLAPIEEPNANAAAFNGEAETEQSSDARQGSQNERINERAEQQQQEENRQIISDLAARDREVRAHEQAHSSVGGQYAGAASYTYQRGPDGVNYAIGGEVPISLPGSGDPQQALTAAEQVRRAALAPAEPSPQDRRVAAAATNQAQDARSAIAEQRLQEQRTERQENVEKQRAAEEEGRSRLDSQQEQEARDQRLDELHGSSRRATQLGDQLVTLDNIQRDRNVGSVLDQQV